MDSAAAFLPKFFVLSSVILIIAGLGQVLVRPRRPKETMVERLVNRATLTALITVSFGVAFLLMGLGVLPLVHFRLG